MSTDWEHNVECVESELAANKASIELILICFLLFLKMIPLQILLSERALRGHFFLATSVLLRFSHFFDLTSFLRAER